MKKILIPLVIFAVLLPLPSNAEGLLMYKPPQTGAPLKRIGGGTRGLGLSWDMPQIQVLAPRHTALTSQAQPVLYWYLSQAKQQTIEFTLVKEGDEQPFLEKRLPTIAKPGLQIIRLANYGVSLQADEEYRWSIAVINGPEQSSGDNIDSATLRYHSPATPYSSVEQQAENGYWYDALQQLIESHSPLADDLLKQIGLDIPPVSR